MRREAQPVAKRWRPGWPACALLLVLAAPLPKASAVSADAQDDGHAVAEMTLAGLHPGRDKLDQAIKLYGRNYSQAFSDTPDFLLWADPKRHVFLRLELQEDKTIQSVTVASYGPASARPAALSDKAERSGRGLRLGDPLEKALSLYGKPYFRGPSTDAGRELLLVVHKFSADEDQPQVLETSFDPKTLRVVKITLSYPYY